MTDTLEAPERLPENAPLAWLRILEEAWPEALLTRFGRYGPFQGRLERDGPEGFARTSGEASEKPCHARRSVRSRLTSPSCVFCSIVAGAAEASVVMRDEAVMAFMDIRPVTRGHLLVMPTDHYEFLAELPAPVAERLFAAARALAASLRASELAPAGVNLLYADGEAAGQEVPHSHLHVIPRYPSDGFTVDAEAWRRDPPVRAELDETAALIAKS